MKKLLLGAMMSALFVTNAEAGLISSVKNLGVKLKNTTVDALKGKKVLDEEEINSIKIITTAFENRAKIYSSYASDKRFSKDERTAFKNISKVVTTLSKFLKTAERNEVLKAKNATAINNAFNTITKNINSLGTIDKVVFSGFKEELSDSMAAVNEILLTHPNNKVLDEFHKIAGGIRDLLDEKINASTVQTSVSLPNLSGYEQNASVLTKSYSTSDLTGVEQVDESTFSIDESESVQSSTESLEDLDYQSRLAAEAQRQAAEAEVQRQAAEAEAQRQAAEAEAQRQAATQQQATTQKRGSVSSRRGSVSSRRR